MAVNKGSNIEKPIQYYRKNNIHDTACSTMDNWTAI
jgi:hypothetical protein